MEDNNKKVFINLRWLTPSLITVAIFILAGILGKVKDIDTRLFSHLTNDEIHCPKSVVVTKPEFLIYQEFRSKEVQMIRDTIKEGFEQLRTELRSVNNRR